MQNNVGSPQWQLWELTQSSQQQGAGCQLSSIISTLVGRQNFTAPKPDHPIWLVNNIPCCTYFICTAPIKICHARIGGVHSLRQHF